MWSKLRISLLISIIISSFSLIYLMVKMPKSQQNNPTNLRISVLIWTNFIILLSLLVQRKVEGLYEKVMLICFTCLISIASMTICLAMIHRIKLHTIDLQPVKMGTYQYLEPIFINIFNITYFFALLGLLVTILYIITIYQDTSDPQIKLDMDQILQEIEYAKDMDGLQCPICLDPMKDKTRIYVSTISCGHLYHRECIQEWLQTKVSCPLCRKDLLNSITQDDEVL